MIADIVVFVILVLICIPGLIGYVRTWRNRGQGGDGSWCESPIERRLYNVLASRGYEVKTQLPCGRYRIDLALPHYRIAIECDGEEFHSTLSQKAHDRKKDRFLRERGWTVLRFTGSQINGKMTYVLRQIEAATK